MATDGDFIACAADPRYGYCEYAPGARPRAVLAVVHGSRRAYRECRDLFALLAEQHGLLLLAPLFPPGLHGEGDGDGYKFLRDGTVRCDLLLLEMIAESAARHCVPHGRFLLAGYSGGGQFVHRFLYLHPARLAAASIGAPGSVTLLDGSKRWWPGIAGAERLFGRPVDIDAVRRVPVHLVVGADDVDGAGIRREPGGRYWVEGANDAGATRIERIAALRSSLEANGVNVRHDLVPGVAHSHAGVAGHVAAFFRDVLAEKRMDPCETEQTWDEEESPC
jgi:dienelactone hydrolase